MLTGGDEPLFFRVVADRSSNRTLEMAVQVGLVAVERGGERVEIPVAKKVLVDERDDFSGQAVVTVYVGAFDRRRAL